MTKHLFFSMILTLVASIGAKAQSYQKLCPLPYEPVYSVVKCDDKMGVIDKSGQFVLPPVYDYVELNALGEDISTRKHGRRKRTPIEMYTANVINGYQYDSNWVTKEEISATTGKVVKKVVLEKLLDRYALAFAVDNSDRDEFGSPRVRVFNLPNGVELLKLSPTYAIKMEVVPLYYLLYVKHAFRPDSSSTDIFMTNVRDFEGCSFWPVVKHVRKYQGYFDYEPSKSLENHLFSTMSLENHFFSYMKKGKRIYFDLIGNESESLRELFEKKTAGNAIKKIRKERASHESCHDRLMRTKKGELLALCEEWNKPAAVSVVYEDSLANVVTANGKYGLQSPKGSWNSGETLNADTVITISDNLYFLISDGYYHPFACDDRRGRYLFNVGFDDIQLTDSGTVFATLSQLGDEQLQIPLKVEIDNDGSVIADNRYGIPSMQLARALEDREMEGLILAARAEQLENTDRRRARELYNQAYERTQNELYLQRGRAITSELTAARQQREDEIREAEERARAALAGLAASMQGLSNSLSQLQKPKPRVVRHTSSTSSGSHRSAAGKSSSNTSSSASSSSVSRSSSRTSATVSKSRSRSSRTTHSFAKRDVTCTLCHGSRHCAFCHNGKVLGATIRTCSNCGGSNVCARCKGTGTIRSY